MKFTVDINRQKFENLFQEEENRFQTLSKDLGTGDEEFELPKLIKKYKENLISIEEPSRVFSITDKKFITENWRLPFNFEEDLKQYNYYWIEFPIRLHSADNWKFTKVEIVLSFNNDEPKPFAKPKIFKIFPDTTFQHIFNIEAGIEATLEVGLDANLNFVAALPTGLPVLSPLKGEGNIKADADANANGKMNFSIGPFSYTYKRAIIEHDVTGSNEIFWKLNKTSYLEEKDLKLIIILQVPKTVSFVNVQTGMIAYKDKTFAPNIWYEYITKAGEAFKSWFESGLPVPAPEKTYDLSSQLVQP